MPGIQELFQLIASNILLYGGTFLVVLSILVFVHEFGHYIVAKWCGVKIDSFSIGFGKELGGFTDKHGTRWKFSMIPLGGYVKMFGDVDPASARQTDTVQDGTQTREMTADERKGAFFSKNVWQRMAIVFAGPGINYLFAIVLLAGLYSVYGQVVTPPQVAAIARGSAADLAGFKLHDQVLEIDGRAVTRFEDIRREVMVKLDTPTEFVVKRGDETLTLTATPQRLESKDHHGFAQSRGYLGVISPANGIDLKFIRSVNGRAVDNADQAREAIMPRLGTQFPVEIDRGETIDTVLIHPTKENNAGMDKKDDPTFNTLNIAQGSVEEIIKHNPLSSIWYATVETYNVTASTLEAIGQMFTGTRSAKELGGIIRIGAIAGDMAQAGIVAMIGFTALLSINLGLINLFPIPMLDGGHLVFYAAEALRGKPVSERIQEYAFRFGLAILVTLMVFANLNDIIQLIL